MWDVGYADLLHFLLKQRANAVIVVSVLAMEVPFFVVDVFGFLQNG